MARKTKAENRSQRQITPADLEDGTVAELTAKRRAAKKQIFEEGEDLGFRAVVAQENGKRLSATDNRRLFELVSMAFQTGAKPSTGLIEALAVALGYSLSDTPKRQYWNAGEDYGAIRDKAIKLEANALPDPKRKAPSVLSERELAQKVFEPTKKNKTRVWENSRRTIAKWRNEEDYRTEVARLRPRELRTKAFIESLTPKKEMAAKKARKS